MPVARVECRRRRSTACQHAPAIERRTTHRSRPRPSRPCGSSKSSSSSPAGHCPTSPGSRASPSTERSDSSRRSRPKATWLATRPRPTGRVRRCFKRGSARAAAIRSSRPPTACCSRSRARRARPCRSRAASVSIGWSSTRGRPKAGRPWRRRVPTPCRRTGAHSGTRCSRSHRRASATSSRAPRCSRSMASRRSTGNASTNTSTRSSGPACGSHETRSWVCSRWPRPCSTQTARPSPPSASRAR
jgi:hypothetical protein